MKKLILLSIVLCLSLSLSACATMYRGTTGTIKEVSMRTDPAGANVVCGNQSFTTPGILQLAKNRSHKIVITKEGYKTVYINVTSKVRAGGVTSSFLSNTGAWGWWTLGIGTAIGMITDTTSGSLRDINVDGIYIPLTPGAGEITLDSSTLNQIQKPSEPPK